MSLTMEILNEGIQVSYTDATGALISKIVDPEDVATALARQVKVDTGILPRNTRYYAKTDRGEVVVLEVPSHIRTVKYAGNQEFTVPFPTTLHFLLVRNADSSGATKVLRNSSCFCIKVPLIAPTTPLFRFPFGNIYSSGEVCWGDVRLPVFTSLGQFGSVPELVFSSEFNGDIDRGVFTPFKDEENNIDLTRGSHLFRYLNGATDFPLDCLIPVMPFNDMLRRFTGGR